MAGLETFANFGAGASGAGDLFTGIGNLGKSLFGSDVNVSGKTETTGSSSQTSKGNQTGETRTGLEISAEAVQKIIEDVLGADDGLASIFAGEQNAGIYNSSVAAQAAGNLASKLVGEIAKLQAQEVTTSNLDQTQTVEEEFQQKTKSKQETEDEGLLEGLF